MGIVQAVGTIVGTADPDKLDLSFFVENAMNEEVKQAQFEGVTDPDIIRARKLFVRDHAILTYQRLNAGA